MYQVSNDGEVRSLDRRVSSKLGSFRFAKGVLMKQQISKKGYHTIILHKDGKASTKQVHRLVAEAFIPNNENLPQVNHKDTNKDNNNVDNLEWITNYDNMQHAIKNNCFPRYTEKRKIAALKNLSIAAENRKRKVVQKDLNNNIINQFDSIIEAARYLGKESLNAHISQCCKNERNQCMGFRWSYYK